MSLYQNSVIKKYLKGIETAKVDEAWEKFTAHFHNKAIQENIRNSKEEQYQGEFLIDLFVNVFGYTKNPTPNFNLTTELKNVKGAKKTDGAILKDEKALAVIELKGTNTTDLAKVENQAFGYKNNQPGCVYVITSNFEKLRFYIDNAVDFEEFNLFQLTRERFEVLWLCLSSEYLLKNTPKQIKDESLTQEENVTKQLYKDYSLFRNEIFDSIQKNNPDYDKLTLFKKTQKLLDRFLFIFFAEDRLLLPPNSIREIINQWVTLRDELDAYVPLYNRFKKYFGYMNTGHKGKKHDIFAYNGGLFAPDEILDNIKIDDTLLYKHTQNLSNYDFESEVSVNILGHIFEHSLNEIEEIQAELQGIETDKKKSKRKKDGVFYTPKYITKYIVDNTVGKLCEEKKIDLEIDEAEYEKDRKGRKKKTLKALLQKLEDYRNWLLELTICDPACGSGAFLNQSLEFLINEHGYIDELNTKLLGESIPFPNIENSILENNLFGVDVNEESVEIAKLSLWLRTAQKGRKLTTLNNNIKCGNSLIDDVEVAGDKAFNWEVEFPKIFKNGGFDVVIGNPPYVQHRRLIEYSDFFKREFKVYTGTSDLSVYFFEQGLKILKRNGLFCYINTNKFFNTEYGKPLRELLSSKNIQEIINFEQVTIFKGALVSSTIISLINQPSESDFKYSEFHKTKMAGDIFERELALKDVRFSFDYIKNNSWTFENPKAKNLVDKIISNGKKVKDIDSIEIKRGITTGYDKAFIISEDQAKVFSKIDDLVKPLLRGKDIQKFRLDKSGLYLLFIPWHYPLHEDKSVEGASTLAEQRLIEDYPELYEHLSSHSENLKNRNKSETGIRYEWYVLQRCAASYYELFDRPKIVWGLISGNWNFALDEGKHFLTSASFFLTSSEYEPLFILGLFNSRLFQFYFSVVGEKTAGGAFVFKKTSIEKFVIPNKTDSSINELTRKRIALEAKIFSHKNQLLDFLAAKYDVEKFTTKLKNWAVLDTKEFLKELKKNKIKTELKDEMELLKLFKEEKEQANNLLNEIYNLDREIDLRIYKLYDLSEEEIKIVEEATA